jgi:ferritin
MLKKKVLEALNKQLNLEFYSSNIYLQMSAYFEHENLGGMAGWMRIQAQEEMAHMMKFYNYINERGGLVIIGKLDAPKEEWKNPLEAFQDALEHERLVTSKIHELMDLALAEKDYATQNFLQWFVDEQVEEEATAESIVEKMKMVEDHKMGIFMMDSELGKRVFTQE